MKRFESNLQKVHNISHQQSRMAELEMARARGAWVEAQRQVEHALQQQLDARKEVNQALQQARQSTIVLGLHQHLAIAAEHLQSAQSKCLQAEQGFWQAQQKYQQLHSQVERLDTLIDKQRETHRQDMLHNQQQTLDDAGIARWSQPELNDTEVSRHG